ncbi:MAG: hypothetical protein ACT4N2_09795 [Hyphomicrobium sp.]
MRFCATGAMVRAGFELTGDLDAANQLRDAACRQLLPNHAFAVTAVEDLNDGSYGHDAVLLLFETYLGLRAR